jgi:nicotinic acid mononucleotide adenylyltransferase
MEELENAVNNVEPPAFSKEELDELNKTGDVDFSSNKKESKAPEAIIKKTVTTKEPVPEETEEATEEELKKLDTAEINISSTEMAKKMSETASIDDLLAMLSIGDDK